MVKLASLYVIQYPLPTTLSEDIVYCIYIRKRLHFLEYKEDACDDPLEKTAKLSSLPGAAQGC